MCEDKIIENGEIDIENYIEVYRFASLHGAKRLEKLCLDYAIKNFEQVRLHHVLTLKSEPRLREGKFALLKEMF